jgi:hypothetical protein
LQHRAFLAAATSENTRRTYRPAIRHFLAWGGILPAFSASRCADECRADYHYGLY